MVMAATTFAASAQLYVGGEVGFWREWQKGANNTEFSLQLEVGYGLSDKLGIGTVIGYLYNYSDGIKTNAFVVAPYLRYTFLKLDKVNLFVDGGFGFATYKNKVSGFSDDAKNAWEVGLKPGVAINLTDKLSFVTHFGFFGYRDADEEEIFGNNGVGFDLNGNQLTFGLYYNF